MKPLVPPFLIFLLRRSRSLVLVMVGAGVASGLLSAGVLAIVNRALSRQPDAGIWWGLAFVLVVAGKIVTQVAAQLMLAKFSQDTMLELSLALCRKIVRAPYQMIERRGAASILVTLSDDVSSLSWAIQSIPQLAMNVAVALGCGVYLAWLSGPTFLAVVLATVVGAIGYQWLHTRAFTIIYEARHARARLFQHFRSLTEGLKELLMHQGRQQEFVERELHAAADAYRRTNTTAATQYALAEAWTHVMFYSLVGGVIFFAPTLLTLSPESLVGYVVVMLYMMSPIWGIIGALPAVGRGQVALENIERLGVSLDETIEADSNVGAVWAAGAATPSIELHSVMFHYDQGEEGQPGFALGPLTFTLAPGELLFLVGGNGSGKSTCVKLLAGLYSPSQGEIRLGGELVTDVNRKWYREHFAVVFSDFFLFDRLYGITGIDTDERARAFLALLAMEHKVEVNARTFSTTQLSQGQRKRLALVTAYLEDRPIYIFDEWAADQDPQYKEIFYRTLLPDLRARGKSIVVITHDDRYFHLGDRVMKLDEGKLVASWTPEPGGASL